MAANAPPTLSIQVPGHVANPTPRPAVSRKAVPSRKPVGQPVIPITSSNTKAPTVARKSIPVTHETSREPKFQGTSIASTNRSSISSFASYSVAQPPKPAVEELPEGWTSAIDPDGRIYYMNHLTKATTWSRPEVIPPELMPGWEERLTPDGRVFYCNTQTHTTTWERPSIISLTSDVTSPTPRECAQSLQPEQKLAPLPLWWEERRASDGRVYFCNTQTQTTTWERPLVSCAYNEPTSQLGVIDVQPIHSQSLPAGWEERKASDDRVYFCNLVTKVTTWERPQLPVAFPKLNPSAGMESPLSPLSSKLVERRTSDNKIEYFNTLTNEQARIPLTPQTGILLVQAVSAVHSPSDLPPTLISPGIDWEGPNYQSKSARRRSNFSLGSISSASTISNRMSKMRIPSGSSSAAVVKGTKDAAEMSLKGMKAAGKVLKNNKGVIIVSLKVAHTILKETTGVDLGGLEDFFGGDVEVDAGEDGGGDCGGDESDVDAEAEAEVFVETYDGGEFGVLAEQQDIVIAQDYENSPQEWIIQDQQPDTYVQEVYIADQYVVSEDSEVVVDTDTVVYEQETVVVEEEETVIVGEEETAPIDEEQTITSNTTIQELTVEQEAAYSGAFSGDSFWVQDTVVVEDQITLTEEGPEVTEQCVQDTLVVGMQSQETSSSEVFIQGVVVDESSGEEIAVRETTFQQAAAEDIVIQTTVCEETTIQMTTFEETSVQGASLHEATATETKHDRVKIIKEESVVAVTPVACVK